MTIPNVLAQRYASEPIREIWSARNKVVAERRLWIAVLRAQRDAGVDVPDGVVEAYEAVIDDVDLESIASRERQTRHDVKARIDEFTPPGMARSERANNVAFDGTPRPVHTTGSHPAAGQVVGSQ